MMNKLLTGVVATSTLMLVSTSCSDTFNPTSDREGRIYLNLTLDQGVKAAKSEAQSRATGYAKEISVDDLELWLESEDGSLRRNWSSVSQFDSSEDFPVGGYTFEAKYGDVTEEGFDKPCYLGTTTLRVKENETTPVELTATLANSMVTLRYTDKVRNYFASFKGMVNSPTGESYVYADGETRAMYVHPGSVSVNIDVTSQTGASGTVNVWTIDAKPRYHYVVTVDKSDAGDATFEITFSTELTEESVIVNLSDDILNAPAPTITASGFTPGQAVSVIEGSDVDGHLDMTIVAEGNVGGATLRTSSASLRAQGWPESVDLATADAAILTTLRKLGLNFAGFDGNKSRMALVDFAGVVEHLNYMADADNTVTFTLEAKDAYNKVSAPMTLTLNVQKLDIAVVNVEPLAINASEVTFDLSFNGGNPNNLTFQVKNDRGIWENVTPISVVESSVDGADYHVTLPVAANDKDVIFRMLRGTTVYPEQTVARYGAMFGVNENNVFATRAILDVYGSNSAIVASSAVVKISTDGVNYTTHESKIAQGGTISLTKLNPGTKYYVKLHVNDGDSDAVEFTTEPNTQLPNSGMEEWCYTGDKKNWKTYYAGSTVESAIWGTSNPMTTLNGGWDYAYVKISGTLNTDDTHSGSAAALLRSVGWGAGNTAIGTIEGGAVCHYLDAGLLHLGASRTSRPEGHTGRTGPISTDDLICGIDFTSRPSALSFWYKYTPKHSSDAGAVEIWVKDAEGNVIAQNYATLPVASDYTQITLPLTYENGAPKGAKIYVKYLSTYSESFLVKKNEYFDSPHFANLSDGKYVASHLYIDDITLDY